MRSDITCRVPRPSDQAYIAKTWQLGLGGDASTRRERGLLIDRVLDDRSTRVAVACDASNLDRIAGFVVYTPTPALTALHWIYVRTNQRREGVARALAAHVRLLDKTIVYTLEGESSAWLRAKYPRVFAMPITEVIR